MTAWSTLFITDGSSSSSSSSEGSMKQPGRHVETLTDTLKCYVCQDYYRRPRILPCGHTFCSECLARLRTTAVEEFNKSRDKNAHRRGDCGFFTCPYPNCHYSMKIMNVGRWSLKNRAMAQAVSMLKRQERQISSAQTDTDITRRLLAWPSVMFASNSHLPDGDMTDGPVPQSPTSAPPVVQQVFMNSCFTTDVIHKKHYEVPADPKTNVWKSYAFVVGITVLEQVLQLTPPVYNLLE